MKNFRQSITFWDCIVKLQIAILSTLLLSLNLCLVHLLSDNPHSIVDSFLSTYLHYSIGGF